MRPGKPPLSLCALRQLRPGASSQSIDRAWFHSLSMLFSGVEDSNLLRVIFDALPVGAAPSIGDLSSGLLVTSLAGKLGGRKNRETFASRGVGGSVCDGPLAASILSAECCVAVALRCRLRLCCARLRPSVPWGTCSIGHARSILGVVCAPRLAPSRA